uniref:Uncharacterized protein n=1 Tax=viral metagenome TaxID=1070528 RepID=A0A6C0CS64_9ZZZZ
MDLNAVQNLKDVLDEFLDHQKDKELQEEYMEMLKQRSVYSFLSILHRIEYDRIHQLLNVTKDMIAVHVNQSRIQKQKSTTDEAESVYSTSDYDSSTTEDEEDDHKGYTGSMFDILMNEE